LIRRLVREALWAPALVLALAALVAGTPQAPDIYWLLHVVGGAALGLFFSRGLLIAEPLFGALRPSSRTVFAFALACSAVLAWEFAEFAVDRVFGTRLQKDNLDTMTDLLLGVCGAALYLAFAALRQWSEESGGR
jgi:hypothetical protein